jgi:hypothetical protein
MRKEDIPLLCSGIDMGNIIDIILIRKEGTLLSRNRRKLKIIMVVLFIYLTCRI